MIKPTNQPTNALGDFFLLSYNDFFFFYNLIMLNEIL